MGSLQVSWVRSSSQGPARPSEALQLRPLLAPRAQPRLKQS